MVSIQIVNYEGNTGLSIILYQCSSYYLSLKSVINDICRHWTGEAGKRLVVVLKFT